jgi:hypothetical protein
MCACVCVRVCVIYLSVGYSAMKDNRREAKESNLAELVDLTVYDQVLRGFIRAMTCAPFLIKFIPVRW